MDDTIGAFIFAMKDKLLLFHLLSDDEVEKITGYFEIALFPAGTILFREGEPGDYIGFIVSGALEVKKQTEFKGKAIVLATLKKGSFVGEMSLMGPHEPRSATVVALEDSELVILKREELDALIDNYPRIGIKILRGLNQILTIRLRKTVDRLTSIF
ncbi:MAG: cyclic nucleotide-binding domain-containing protein [Nitrospiraceae bacterium]|nr:MAG: cyclic nucleotide-binding domain-containing protein [Nitrospiraceae bacterium]